MRDPYAIYARRILRLKPLDRLDAEIGPMERGTLVHEALETFTNTFSGVLPDDAVLQLDEIAASVFEKYRTPKSAQALWRPRFLRAAAWFVGEERERRTRIERSLTEVKSAEWPITEGFTLHGVADRIDLLTGGGAAILDYKTGKPPAPKQIMAFLAPQLLLEAAMLQAGAFEAAGTQTVRELLYVWFSGGRDPGAIEPVDLSLVAETVARLKAFIASSPIPATPYRPRVAPYPRGYLRRLRSPGARPRMVAQRMGGGMSDPSLIAADPRRSAWVAANAGSGKTYTLANRVTRLLLADTEPAKILCLTYTKAAAAEMQGRLFKQLGEWSMLPDDDLAANIAEIGAEPGGTNQLRKARRLFAQALETPGGLKIQTIHAFCQSRSRAFRSRPGSHRLSTCWTSRPRAN